MYVIVDPNDCDFPLPNAVTKVFEGFANRFTKLVEFAVNCGVCYRDSKAGEEFVNEAVGVTGEEDDTCDLGEKGDGFVPQIE